MSTNTQTNLKLQSELLTCIIQQYIFWFQVSVDDPVLVEVLQPTDDLSCVETCSLLLKTRIFFIHIVHMKPVKMEGVGFYGILRSTIQKQKLHARYIV